VVGGAFDVDVDEVAGGGGQGIVVAVQAIS
jgi:hypothetical protein